MQHYIYQASIYCKSCGEELKKELTEQGKAPENPGDFETFDSGDFPKGPFPRSMNESDSPEHCHDCGIFLENPLTDHGVDYVYRRIKGWSEQKGEYNKEIVKEWLDYYSCYEKIAQLKSELIDKGLEIAQ